MIALQSSFAQYFDTQGEPLTNGSVYIGTVNENPVTNPIPVYWDAAGTQPAAQPLKTLNGVIARNGSPAQVYVATDYSVASFDQAGVLIFSLPSSGSSLFGLASSQTFDTRTDAAAATIASSVNFVVVVGLAAVGDGGDGFYQSVSNVGTLLSYQFQSNGGTRRWQIVPQYGSIRPQQLSVCGGADDKNALVLADGAAFTLGVELMISMHHNIGSSFAHTAGVRFVPGGQYIPAANALITFGGGFDGPPDYAIFNFGAGSSGFGSASVTGKALYPQMFGAKGDGVTMNDAAWTEFENAVKASHLTGKIPPGRYKFAAAHVCDLGAVQSIGMRLEGIGGKGNVILDWTTAGLASQAAAYTFNNTTVQNSFGGYDTDYLELQGFSIWTKHDGPAGVLARSDLLDPMNMPILREMAFVNENNSANAIGLLVNFALGGDFFIQATCGADPNNGIPTLGVGMQLVQSEFNRFSGSYGTAGIGIKMSGGISAGNLFLSCDIENAGVCVEADHNTIQNTWIAGTWNYYTNGFNDDGGSGSRIINPNVNPSGPTSTPPGNGTVAGFITGAGTGVIVDYGPPASNPPPNNVSTPPVSAQVYTNTTGQKVFVEVWWSSAATSVTNYSRNGFERGITPTAGWFGIPLDPGDTFFVTFTGTAPTWFWSNF